MQKCIYTVLQSPWIEATQDYFGQATFWSFKVWVTAQKILQEQTSLPIFIRHAGREEQDSGFLCHYRAELIAIKLAREFENPEEKRTWAQDHLCLQKVWLQTEWSNGRGDRERFSNWQEQFEAWEMSSKINTWFTIQNVQPVDPPFPISQLLKYSDGLPLSDRYQRSYAVCLTPTKPIEVASSGNRGL